MYDKDENSEARFFARMYSRMMMFPTFEKAFSALNMSDEQRAVSLVHMVDTVLSIESLTHFKFQLLNIKRLGVQHRGRTRPGDYRLFGDILLSTLIEMYGPRRITPTIVKSLKKSFMAIGEVMQLGENENKPLASGSEVQSIKLRSRRKSMGDVMLRTIKKNKKKKKERPRTGRGGRRTHWPETCEQATERRQRTPLKRYRSKSGIAQEIGGQNHEAFIEEMKQEKEKAKAKARRAEKRQMQRRKTYCPNIDKDMRSKDWLLMPLQDCTEEEEGKTQIKEETNTDEDEAESQADKNL